MPGVGLEWHHSRSTTAAP
uniref:Uncharacterized protein n=1 Tax=Arundo donax TaxID=35708 RepID=A0A0A9BNZ6_ARUDO